MIQFNLLPDIKLEYMRMRRTKRTVMMVSSTISVVALSIFIMLLAIVLVVQPKHISNMSQDIKKSSKDLQDTEGLDQILTIQNQLNSLTTLHQAKPDTTRLVEYVKQFTPAEASLSSVNVDFVAKTLIFTGKADSIQTVNKYVDTLKFTKYKFETQNENAFSEVVLSSFSTDKSDINFTINLKYNEILFDNTKTVTLEIPKTITTRSEVEKPKLLFEPAVNRGNQ